MVHVLRFLSRYPPILFFFFFNDTATTEIYTLSLHDALPIYENRRHHSRERVGHPVQDGLCRSPRDRKSTRLNSSHDQISYAVFCLKKKKRTVEDYLSQRIVDDYVLPRRLYHHERSALQVQRH